MRTVTKKILLIGVFVLMAVCLVFAGAIAAFADTSENTLTSSGDKIATLEKTYSADESFVYTVRANFVSGQAAGIAFGIDEQGSGFVLNVDRQDNRTKLMYFKKVQDSENYEVTVLKEDYYIGNENSAHAQADLSRVADKVRAKSSFYLKVAVSGGSVKCYVDDILRFDYENAIALGESQGVPAYEGGQIGYSVFNSEVVFDEIYYASDDYTRYTELYRNQYHYSPFSGWNNDPNGLVFDGEYYHLYYQTQPFQKTWGDMYWGHARSKDLLTWENLPIAMLPYDEGGHGNFMWSGSAIIDKDNESRLFSRLYDNDNGYDGSKNILIAYTVDGGPTQDQWLAYSLDGGITFTDYGCIISGSSVDRGNVFRDPKIFRYDENNWGIIIGGGILRFYLSQDLLNWTFAGDLPIDAECPDIYPLKTDNGTKWVINAGGIGYVVGDLTLEGNNFVFVDQFGTNLTATDDPSAVKIFDLDNANGSYATQTFYIDDERSQYNGRAVGISWFAGQPGHQPPMDSHLWLTGEQAVGPDTGVEANLRSIWNCGMTFPVEYSLTSKSGAYLLCQSPVDTSGIQANVLYTAEGLTVGADDDNILASVRGNTARIEAEVRTQAESFGFRLFAGDGEYTEVGFDSEKGYYLDRTMTASGGIDIPRYAEVYSTGINDYIGNDGVYTFVILLDRGSLEMFCDDCTQAFYANTFADFSSDGMQFFTSGEAEIDITVTALDSVYNTQPEAGSGRLVIAAESVTLDTGIVTQRLVKAYGIGGQTISWTAEDEDMLSVVPAEGGAVLTALRGGDTTVRAQLLDEEGKVIDEKALPVKIYEKNEQTTNLHFTEDGITAGTWNATQDGILAEMAGDGFIFAEGLHGDFTYEVTVELKSAGAAALVFRANPQLNDYFVANYDRAARVVKVWRGGTEYVNVSVGEYSSVTLKVTAVGREFSYYFNGERMASFVDYDAPYRGLLGLNVFNGTALFRSVKVGAVGYTFSGDDILITPDSDREIAEVYNVTADKRVGDEYFMQKAGTLWLLSDYLCVLTSGTYTFNLVDSEGGTQQITVKVISNILKIPDVVQSEFSDVQVTVGLFGVVGVRVNAVVLDAAQFSVADGILRIGSQTFGHGDNIVAVELESGREVCFLVTMPSDTPAAEEPANYIAYYIAGGVAAFLVVAGVATFFIVRMVRKKKQI